MPHPSLINTTPFAVELLPLADEEGAALVVACVQATFGIGATGELELAEPQPTILVGGRWRGDPATTSLLREPLIAFTKPATDVVLIGHAHATRPGQTEGMVGIRLGPVQKTARVLGDRRWLTTMGVARVSAPLPFERIPICPELAFGGWDRRAADPLQHRCDPRNPVGRGFLAAPPGDQEPALPNFEDPQQPITAWDERPAPATFGFVSGDWQPRLALAGTYDLLWQRQRRPLLPVDFDRRFFNAAAPGLVTQEPLRGDESAVVIGATPQGRLELRLPGLPPPQVLLSTRGRRRVDLQAMLDTVLIDLDENTLTMTWRACTALRNGLHDLVAAKVHIDDPRLKAAAA